MKQKTHKTDVRIYIDDDYKTYLKTVADRKGISVNQLVMDLIKKKYPYNKKARAFIHDCMVPEQPSYDNEIPLDAGTGDTAFTSSCERVDTHSAGREMTATSEEDTNGSEVIATYDEETEYNRFDDLLSKGSEPSAYTNNEICDMRNRITKIKSIIETARTTGNHLPKQKYSELVEQKKRLIAIVYPNGNNKKVSSK